MPKFTAESDSPWRKWLPSGCFVCPLRRCRAGERADSGREPEETMFSTAGLCDDCHYRSSHCTNICHTYWHYVHHTRTAFFSLSIADPSTTICIYAQFQIQPIGCGPSVSPSINKLNGLGFSSKPYKWIRYATRIVVPTRLACCSLANTPRSQNKFYIVADVHVTGSHGELLRVTVTSHSGNVNSACIIQHLHLPSFHLTDHHYKV